MMSLKAKQIKKDKGSWYQQHYLKDKPKLKKMYDDAKVPDSKMTEQMRGK